MERLKDRPFALIGVNSDKDPEAIRPELEKAGVTWRSFWNGPGGTEGPISELYNIDGWPTIYVLDEAGIIRHKGLRGAALEAAVDTLLE